MRQYTLHSEPSSCEHRMLDVVPTPDGPHYAKEVCKICGRFMRWLPKPENQARIEENQKRHKILCGLKLTPREQDFMRSCEKQKFRLTEKQQAWLDGIWERHK